MPKVTSKLQVTVPKAIADRYRIKPGDEILWVASGESIRVLLPRGKPRPDSLAARMRTFDRATERQRSREAQQPRDTARARGWKREDLYERGRSR